MSDYFSDSGDFDGPAGMEKVICVLTTSHIDLHGGYPYDYEQRDGMVFIAALDPSKEHNRTMLKIYDEHVLMSWEVRARKFREETGADWWECVSETAP